MQTETRSYLLPYDLSEALIQAAEEYGVGIDELSQAGLKIGLWSIQKIRKGAKYFIREHKGAPLEKLVFSKFTTSPAEDVITLKENLCYFDGTAVKFSDQPLQKQARLLVAEAAYQIQQTYGQRLTGEYQQILEQIAEGALVAKDLSNVESSNPLPLNEHCLSMVVLKPYPYKVVLIDEDYLSNKQIDKTKKLHTVAHEIWHIIGEKETNDLPILLKEAGADIYADRTIGNFSNQKRLGNNFPLAFEIWSKMEEVAGEEAVFQAYLHSPYTEMRVDLENGQISERFIDLLLYEQMRKYLGRNRQGREYWGQVLQLIEEEDLPKAYQLVFSRPLLQRIKTFFQSVKGH